MLTTCGDVDQLNPSFFIVPGDSHVLSCLKLSGSSRIEGEVCYVYMFKFYGDGQSYESFTKKNEKFNEERFKCDVI